MVWTLCIESSGVMKFVEEFGKRSIRHFRRVKYHFDSFGVLGVSAAYLAVVWVIHIATDVAYSSRDTIFLEMLYIQMFNAPT
jgi:hypothetical protein